MDFYILMGLMLFYITVHYLVHSDFLLKKNKEK